MAGEDAGGGVDSGGGSAECACRRAQLVADGGEHHRGESCSDYDWDSESRRDELRAGHGTWHKFILSILFQP